LHESTKGSSRRGDPKLQSSRLQVAGCRARRCKLEGRTHEVVEEGNRENALIVRIEGRKLQVLREGKARKTESEIEREREREREGERERERERKWETERDRERLRARE
jgi:hypothetical protein